ncbi:MAG: hypothetical protein IJ439_02915 [Tyzzerella sp.]|nr:hypothetical protein [Tyzzerella sp.]
MKREKISNALNDIDEKYVQEAANPNAKVQRQTYRKVLVSFGTVAACFCIVLGGIVLWNKAGKDDIMIDGCIPSEIDSSTNDSGISVSEDGVTIPKMDVTLSLPNGAAADMVAFFIYQGRCYVQDGVYDVKDDFVGEYLGTATGMINEWTPKEGYVELAGSVSGDFYSVNGYDPSFMLCMKGYENTVSTFVNDNGITLKYGSDLFEDRLHMTNHYTSVEYLTREDWYESRREPILLDEEYAEIVNVFVDALNASEFMILDDIPLAEGETNVYDDKEIYHLYFNMENGMTVHLRLFEGGYVSYQGIKDVCVKLETAPFENLIQALNN